MELSKRCRPERVVFVIISFLLTWIAVNYISTSSDLNPPIGELSYAPLSDGSHEPQRLRVQVEEVSQGGNCDTRDGHYLDDIKADMSEESAWSQMKWIGQPAPCRVRGELIERLDDVNNFRRGYALGFAGNVEDRTHILPWLLGAKVDLNRRKRRVFLDLGSNKFTSSLQWFMRMYPCDFTEIHAFEVLKDLLVIPKPFDEKNNRAGENARSRRTKQKPGIPAWMLKRIKVHNQLVSDADDLQTGAINITKFIKHDLKLKAEDAVIVKMDIEESEWPILTRWLNDPEMVEIVDEIFVEIHYKHGSMYNFHWNRFSHPRSEAKRLLADLRWKGFYAHFWP